MFLHWGLRFVRFGWDQTSELADLPMVWIFAAWPIAGATWLLFLGEIFYDNFDPDRRGRPPTSSPAEEILPGAERRMTQAALSPGMASLVLFGSFFFLIVLRVPVAFALGLACLPVLLFEDRLSPMVLFNETFKSYNSFILLAVPFFLLTAHLMNIGGITDRLVRLSRAMVGNWPGALAQINVLLSVFFAGISGSSTADAASQSQDLHRCPGEGGLRPVLLDRHHGGVGGARGHHTAVDPDDRLGRRDLGLDRRALSCRRRPGPPHRRRPDGDGPRLRQEIQLPALPAGDACGNSSAPCVVSIPALVTPFIIVGGILLGWFTATESACVAVIYAAALSMFFYREMDLRQLYEALLETGRLSAVALFCVGTASAFGWLLAYYQIPRALLANVTSWGMGPIGVGFFIAFAFLVVGCFLDAIPAIIIVGTTLEPLSRSVDMHPVHFAIIAIVSLAFGLVTPPYGLCLMVACAVAKVRLRYALKDTVIMLVPMLMVLAAIIVWPELVLFLPRLISPEFLR